MTRAWVKGAVVACLIASSSIGHLGYPAVLVLASGLRRRSLEVRLVRGFSGAVTVVVPAHRESGIIAAKISSLRDLQYAGEVRILVVTDGCAATADAARAAGAEVLELPRRRGKSQALNAAMVVVDTDVVVFSDANSRLALDAVTHLVEPFGDETIGATTGEKREGEGGELTYWRFSGALKRLESGLGSTLGIDGALAAVRRSAWAPIPEDISNDDYWVALDMMERGFRVQYVPEAVVQEESIGGVGPSWQRRTRVLGGSLRVAWRKRHLLRPGAGLIALEMWGHKLWRSTIGPISHAALLVLAVRSIRTSRVARGALVVHGYALLTVLAPGLPLQALGQVLFLQTVAFGGMARVLSGDRMILWRKPSR